MLPAVRPNQIQLSKGKCNPLDGQSLVVVTHS